MRRARSVVVVLAFGLVVAACSDTATTTTTDASPSATSTTQVTTTQEGTISTTTVPPSTIVETTTTTRPVEDGSLVGRPAIDPGACAFGEVPGPGAAEVTFVRDGYLLAANRSGTLRCVAPFENQERVVWGPAGDRLLLDTTRITADDAYSGIVGEDASFTRPTGRNLVWVEDGRLWKSATDGTSLRDISFLGEHVAVAYHPAGVEIATVGIDEDGRYGVWVARNDGTEAQRVVTAEEATITEVAFSESSGFFLSFIARHQDGTSHLHELTLVDAQGLAVRNEFDASIALETDRTLSGIVANPWSDEIAVTEGSCGDPEGPRARLPWGGDIPAPLTDMATEAVAWLPDFELLLAAYPNGCDEVRELWIVGTGEGLPAFDNPELLAIDVGVTAVRAAFPDPPIPLGDVDLDDFA